MRHTIFLLLLCMALLCGCQTFRTPDTRLAPADIELLVVHAEMSLDVAETGYEAWLRVAERTGMLPLEVAGRRAQWEQRIALLRGHLEWLRGKVVEREGGAV